MIATARVAFPWPSLSGIIITFLLNFITVSFLAHKVETIVPLTLSDRSAYNVADKTHLSPLSSVLTPMYRESTLLYASTDTCFLKHNYSMKICKCTSQNNVHTETLLITLFLLSVIHIKIRVLLQNFFYLIVHFLFNTLWYFVNFQNSL